MTVLLVVATEGEAARLRGLPARVVVSGVGPVAAALATQAALLPGQMSGQGRPGLVVSAGIGGAYPGSGLEPGGAAIASRMVYGDLGAWDGETFLTLAELRLERPPAALSFPAWPGGEPLAGRLGLPYGPFVTLSAATGSLDGARRLQRQVLGALIEGMEGAGVAQAAALAGVPCTEVRGVSNHVGPRDRASWRVAEGLSALETVLAALLGELGVGS